jgi:uncharacterized hydrophobic protein (TIGR00271 family)
MKSGRRGEEAMVLSIAAEDLDRMRRELLFDGPERGRKLSRYWMLLILASVIAGAGVMADSTATVIGAMIVAPLMTPILGTVLCLVRADLRNLATCLVLVVAGALAVIAVGLMLGTLTPVDVVAATNSQVSGRVHPRLIDLVGALATGAVGAFAMVRSDVSDTLPGVAISISLVPPLAVVGLTLQSGASGESLGALLLFLTNVGAILLSGLVVMSLYRVRRVVAEGAPVRAYGSRAATVVVIAIVAALALPLSVTSQRVAEQALTRSEVADVARSWASDRGWEVLAVDTDDAGTLVRTAGPLPIPEPASFRAALDEGGLEALDVRLELTPSERVDLPGR